MRLEWSAAHIRRILTGLDLGFVPGSNGKNVAQMMGGFDSCRIPSQIFGQRVNDLVDDGMIGHGYGSS